MLAGLKEETIHGVWAVVFFVLALFLMLAAFELGGLVGVWIFKGLTFLLGIGYFLLPALLIVLSISFLSTLKQHMGIARAFGSTLFFVSGLGLIDLVFDGKGGLIGNYISSPLLKLFDLWATSLLLLALSIISILVILDIKLSLKPLTQFMHRFNSKRKSEEFDGEDYKYENDDEYDEKEEDEDEEKLEDEDDELDEEGGEDEKKGMLKEIFKEKEEEREKEDFSFYPTHGASYIPPPVKLLERDRGKPDVGDVKANANIIKRTLQNFGVQVEMDEVSIGPSVTRYALKPAEGVRLSKIVGLQNNLELALAAHPVRIEAPIPGKALVGIEVPNNTKSTVGLATLFSSEAYRESQKPLLIALGKDIAGRSHLADLAKMPHILIAGTTGSGKSVTIHSIILSLLYRNSPAQLKFIMIDPKRVELPLYNTIPHLLTPVITDAKKTILALKWAAKEMDRRYNILETESVRDIESYHKNILAPALKQFKKNKSEEERENLPETMPYFAIVIDEIADIMQAYPRELEAAIVRLAQMSRAVGIHLILSTQRPSVNVLTGLIKANIPARIALQVSSQIDSRTILDSSGAEKLLGAGDMLYISGDMSKPIRIQAPYVSEDEVKKVVNYLIKNYEDEPTDSIELTSAQVDSNVLFHGNLGDDEDEPEDALYEEAHETVLHAGKASTSYLQRKLRVGYARAARLMDMLEERGVIGPPDGSKPREVLEPSVRSNDDKEDFEEDE
ncbi:hypothetical protein IIC45_01415 [Patescibacteria group bacterium]|nr:hypothetical protein [Patescibacteria group bacterium]